MAGGAEERGMHGNAPHFRLPAAPCDGGESGSLWEGLQRIACQTRDGAVACRFRGNGSPTSGVTWGVLAFMPWLVKVAWRIFGDARPPTPLPAGDAAACRHAEPRPICWAGSLPSPACGEGPGEGPGRAPGRGPGKRAGKEGRAAALRPPWACRRSSSAPGGRRKNDRRHPRRPTAAPASARSRPATPRPSSADCRVRPP